MDTFTSRFEILNSFESSMRILLRQRCLCDKEQFLKHMLVVIRYVGSIKEGVVLAQEIKSSFEYFLPKIEHEWKDAVYTPLLKITEKYSILLAEQLQKQQDLFNEINLIISSFDIVDGTDAIKATVKSTLVPITLEFKILKILCHIHNILFRKDQEKLNEAIEEFLKEFQQLDTDASQPLLQIRGIIEQIKVAAEMPFEAKLIKELLERVIGIAQNFIHKFCGE